MDPIRFEAADSAERTQIGEGLTKFAVRAGRLEMGGSEGKYFLRHADGCAVCGERVAPGRPFYFDPETGEILCAEHGRERRGDD
jgi:rRNA maturation protein Nop10